MIVGIDFGTTDLRCAVMETGAPKPVPCGEDGSGVTTVVSIDDDGRIRVGQAAADLGSLRPGHSVADLMRRLGREDAVELGGHEYVPEGLAATLFRRVVEDVETVLDADVDRAVVTVPAAFGYRQRRAVRDAGEIAGLDVVRLVTAPTAAALADAVGSDGDRTVLTVDLGGGTLDVGAFALGGGVFEVLATDGDCALGGVDWDRTIAQDFLAESDDVPVLDARGRRRLRRSGLACPAVAPRQGTTRGRRAERHHGGRRPGRRPPVARP